jgi:hypothetical protein
VESAGHFALCVAALEAGTAGDVFTVEFEGGLAAASACEAEARLREETAKFSFKCLIDRHWVRKEKIRGWEGGIYNREARGLAVRWEGGKTVTGKVLESGVE